MDADGAVQFALFAASQNCKGYVWMSVMDPRNGIWYSQLPIRLFGCTPKRRMEMGPNTSANSPSRALPSHVTEPFATKSWKSRVPNRPRAS